MQIHVCVDLAVNLSNNILPSDVFYFWLVNYLKPLHVLHLLKHLYLVYFSGDLIKIL